jgi:hypothetical protein
MKLSDPMLENVVTMLGWSTQGGTIARMLDGIELPDDYALVSQRCIDYWRDHKQPPGVHLVDLFDDIPPTDARTAGISYILSSMQQIKDGINPEFVLGKMSNFRRLSRMRQAVLDVAKTLQNDHATTVAEAEGMLGQLLRSREIEFDPGLSLESYEEFLAYLNAERGMRTGIAPLDKIGVAPTRKTLFTVLAVTGQGKTWWLVHIGAQALQQKLKVVHFSLEIDAAAVLQRYYQSLFSVSEHDVKHLVTRLVTDPNSGRVTNMVQKDTSPTFAFRNGDGGINPSLETELTVRLVRLGGIVENLRIRAWPPRVTSIDSIEAYLDTLSDTQHFEPDLIIVDYPQLMKASVKNFRLELGQNVEHLRRLAIERNCAVCIVHQSSREGAKSKSVGMTHVAEDWSVVQTSDFVLSYSATSSERRLGLARLHIDKARAPGAVGRTMILSQNYDIGQYCLSSVLIPDNYLDYMERAMPPEHDDEEDGVEEEGE